MRLNKIMNIKLLQAKAKKLRKDTFQAFIKKKEAHLGGSFSMIEILLFIYEIILKKNDKFILSKAHASFPLCILLRNKGFKPKLSTHLELDEKNTAKRSVVPDTINQLNILVVDDNPIAREIFETYLLQFGFNVELVDSGEKAIEKILNKEIQYDLHFRYV